MSFLIASFALSLPGMTVVRKVFSFSIFQFAFLIINYISRNLDKLLMGRYLSMKELGYYDKSYRLMMMPLQYISFVVTPVMHPVLAQIQDDKKQIASSYIKVVKLMSYIGFPLSILLFFIANDLVLFFFGEQWGPSVPCFRLLALSVGFQIASSTSGAVFQAANDTKRMFGCGLFTAVVNLLAISLGIFLFKTAEAVAAGLCLAFFASFVQCYIFLFKKSLGYGWNDFLKCLVKPLALSGILAIVLWPLSKIIMPITFVSSATLNHFLICAILCCIALIVSLAFVQISGDYDIVGKLRRTLRI